MKRYPIVGFDPAFRNWGYCVGTLGIDDLSIQIDKIGTFYTQKETAKQVRVNCDDLRCAKYLYDNLKELLDNAKPVFTFAELPHGAQTSRAAVSYASCVSLCAALCPAVMIVDQRSLKFEVGNRANTSKEEMIQWCAEKYPHLPWVLNRKGELSIENEHMADSIVAIHVGIKTQQFNDVRRSLIEILK